MEAKSLGGGVTMDQSARADARQHPRPDAAYDVAHGFEARFDAIHDIEPGGRNLDCPGADIAHPFLKPMLQMQPPDHPTRDDGDGEPENQVGQRHFPAHKAEQQAQGHLVDHRRRDQEGEGDAQRHARADKADE